MSEKLPVESASPEPPAEKQRKRPSLSRAKDKVAAVLTPDDLDKSAARTVDAEAVADRKQVRDLRESYSQRVFWYLVAYSSAALLLVFLHGWRVLGFQLDTVVLSLVVGSTAVSAIGLVGIVVKGLFKT